MQQNKVTKDRKLCTLKCNQNCNKTVRFFFSLRQNMFVDKRLLHRTYFYVLKFHITHISTTKSLKTVH